MPHPMIMAEDEICKHYRIILEQADQEEAAPIKGKRGRPKQSPGRNLLNRLREHQDGILAFALRIEVPFTNNQAERDPRLSKGKLKVSGCLRTVRGARIYGKMSLHAYVRCLPFLLLLNREPEGGWLPSTCKTVQSNVPFASSAWTRSPSVIDCTSHTISLPGNFVTIAYPRSRVRCGFIALIVRSRAAT